MLNTILSVVLLLMCLFRDDFGGNNNLNLIPHHKFDIKF